MRYLKQQHKNDVFCLCYDCVITPYYLFCRGAKLCLAKTKRKAKHAEMLTQEYVITRKPTPSVHSKNK